MDDLFDFSFPGFDGLSDSFSGFGDVFGSLGLSIEESLPDITEQIAKFALNQALGGRSSRNPTQQLLNSFARNAFSGQSRGYASGNYFQRSQGQSMAQLAAQISRAGRRFL